jgi:tRNA(Ile)-lysidine synthase
MTIIEKVRKTIRQHAMLQGGETVLVGLSGGPDSVCLLSVLNALKDEFRLSLFALYIDHGLRPDEFPGEVDFCRRLAEGMNIPFETLSVDVRGLSESRGIGIQEAARMLRYEAFEQKAILHKTDRIATGHHRDDQAETVLLRLLRGSGMRGLSGIPPVRGKVIRPLIDLRREEIMNYLRERGLSFLQDSSNLSPKYLRNRIRQELIPFLSNLNPSVVDTLSRTADVLREEDAYLDIKTTKALMRLITRKGDDTVEFFLAPLENMEKVILRRALRRVIEETRGLRGIGLEHIEEIIGLIREGKSGDRIYLPGGFRAIKGYATIEITSREPVRLGEYELKVPGETVIKEAGIVLVATEEEEADDFGNGKTAAVFERERLCLPLRIRPRREGDWFHPFGMGGRKKIHDFFVDEKIPRDMRDAVPLLLSGEDIIWVVGYRTDERYRVREGSKGVLRIEVKKGRF